MAITDRLLERIKKHEGYKRDPYKDTVDKWTVGYGRNLEDNPLSLEEVLALFNRTEFKNTGMADNFFEDLLVADIRKHTEELKDKLAIFPMCDQDEQTVLIDMAFNLGVPTLLSFKGMLHAIDNDDKVEAAVELLDSKYAEQVKTRAVDNAKLLAGSGFQEALDRLEKKNPRRYKIIEGYI